MNLTLHSDGKNVGGKLNLGERENNREKKGKKKKGRRRKGKKLMKRKKKPRPNGSPSLKVLFPPFCGLSEKGFYEISPSQPTKSLLLEELLFFSCS